MSLVLLAAWKKTLRRHGGRRAVVEAVTGRVATFRELDDRAEAWLAATGAQEALEGHTVVFALPNGIEWLAIFLGLMKAGAVAVPLDPGEPATAQARLVRSVRAGFWWNGTALVAGTEARRYRGPEICLIKLTSGSTGEPRPLVFTAAQMLADARQVTSTMGITAGDLNYALIPLGHSYGLGNVTVPLLAHGVPAVCGSGALPHAIATDFAQWSPTVFPGVPVMWRGLAASDVKLASLRLPISAGAPLPAEVARDFAARYGRKIHSFYGSSETGGIAYDRTGGAALAGTVGRALRGVKLRLRAGGRLIVSSAAVTTHGNRHRSGTLGAWVMPDRVQLGATGEVTLLGRRGASVKIGGRRISLNEVLARLRRVPGVRDAWVAVSEGADAVLGAAVATELTPMELRTALLADTAAWKIPKRLVTLPSLPVNARGKTDSSALRALVFR